MPWLAISHCSPRQLIVASLRPVDCCFLMFEYFLNEKLVPLLTLQPRAAAMPLPMFCDVVITPCFCWLACWQSCSCCWLLVYFFLLKSLPLLTNAGTAATCTAWHCCHATKHKIVLLLFLGFDCCFSRNYSSHTQVGQCHCHCCMATAEDRASNAIAANPESMCCCFLL